MQKKKGANHKFSKQMYLSTYIAASKVDLSLSVYSRAKISAELA